MRIFSYRNKRALRRALLIALLAVVLIGLLILARISYLGRGLLAGRRLLR